MSLFSTLPGELTPLVPTLRSTGNAVIYRECREHDILDMHTMHDRIFSISTQMLPLFKMPALATH